MDNFNQIMLIALALMAFTAGIIIIFTNVKWEQRLKAKEKELLATSHKADTKTEPVINVYNLRLKIHPGESFKDARKRLCSRAGYTIMRGIPIFREDDYMTAIVRVVVNDPEKEISGEYPAIAPETTSSEESNQSPSC